MKLQLRRSRFRDSSTCINFLLASKSFQITQSRPSTSLLPAYPSKELDLDSRPLLPRTSQSTPTHICSIKSHQFKMQTSVLYFLVLAITFGTLTGANYVIPKPVCLCYPFPYLDITPNLTGHLRRSRSSSAASPVTSLPGIMPSARVSTTSTRTAPTAGGSDPALLPALR